MFWKRKNAQPTPVATCALALYEAIADAVTQNGRIHVEDLISAVAAIVGELSIGVAGDFNPHNHKFPPGGRVFSTNVNLLISGDKDFIEAPADSIVGILRDKLTSFGFTIKDFPAAKDVFSFFAANIGKVEDWGKVPLSVPKEHHPIFKPLITNHQLRPTVDGILAPLVDPKLKLHAATLALAEALCKTKDVLNRRIAIAIAIETINGMSKTAPMTEAVMAKILAEKKP